MSLTEGHGSGWKEQSLCIPGTFLIILSHACEVGSPVKPSHLPVAMSVLCWYAPLAGALGTVRDNGQ